MLRGSAAGDEAQQSIFTVQNPEKEALGLRFDLTVPLARVVAQYHDLPRPFRRYQVSPVWRADKPDQGRFREFTQFDLDSVGVESEIADTEIIAGMCDTLTALKVGPYRVRFSSRGVLNLLLAFAGIPAEQGVDVFRVLDKLDKVGPEKVRLELTDRLRRRLGRPDPRRRPRLRVGGPDRAVPRRSGPTTAAKSWPSSASSSPASTGPTPRWTWSSGSPATSTASATATTRSRSTSRSPAASPTTPVPCSRRSCSTRRSSAPSSAAAATTTW